MHEIETVNVKLENLKPFSGVLYDKNNVAIRFEGNPFYVPQDYLPAKAVESEEADTDEDTESAEQEKPSEPVASLRRLHASIEAEGLLTPILVRPAKTENPEEYEILSGYRRKRVCEFPPSSSTVMMIRPALSSHHQTFRDRHSAFSTKLNPVDACTAPWLIAERLNKRAKNTHGKLFQT